MNPNDPSAPGITRSQGPPPPQARPPLHDPLAARPTTERVSTPVAAKPSRSYRGSIRQQVFVAANHLEANRQLAAANGEGWVCVQAASQTGGGLVLLFNSEGGDDDACLPPLGPPPPASAARDAANAKAKQLGAYPL